MRRRPLLLTLLATLALLVGSTGHAYGQPSPEQIEAELDKKWAQIEPVIEEHNALRIKLNNEKKKVAQLAAQLAPLEQEVAATRSRVGIYAEYMYKGGRAAGIDAYLSTGDPTLFAERITSMDQVTRHFNSRIDEVLAAKSKLDEAKQPLDALVAQLTELQAQQAAQIKTIDAEIKKLDQMRAAAYGSGSGTGELKPVPCPATYPGGAAAKAINFACSQIGKMYKYATDGPNTYDCSGLTLAAWRAAGVDLPHQSRAQRAAIPHISRSQLRAGDLVFYYSPIHHVALYAGKHNGKDWIVHASRAGTPVKMRLMDQGGNIHSYGRPG